MKVNRYLYGRTNVSQLESGRAALRTPGEVAAEAYVPYGAVAEVAQNIRKDLKHVEERQKRIQALEDQQTTKIIGVKQKAIYGNIVDDPANRDQEQEGVGTGSIMLEEYERRSDELRADLDQIQDPVTRANAEEIFNLATDQNRVAMRNEVADRAEEWHMKGQFDLRDVALDNEDWAMYAELNNEILDAGAQSQDQYAKAEKISEVAQKNIEVEDTLASFEQDIATGYGETVLKNQLENKHSDPDVQDAIIAGIKAQMYNYNLSEQKAKDAQVAGWMREADNLINSIATEGAVIDVDSMYRTMLAEDVDPTKAATLANRVSAAMRSKVVKDDGYDLFKSTVSISEPVDNNKANRMHTDRYTIAALEENDALPEGQQQSPIDVEIGTYKAVGLVGQKWQTRLESANTAEGLSRSAEFWSALHSDPYREVEDGLSGPRKGIYEMIERRAQDGGMSWIDASHDVMDITKLDETQREVRQQVWVDEEGGDKADKYYGKLMDSNAYDKSNIPFHSGVDGINHEENKLRYRMYLQDGLTLTGNWEDARVHANAVFEDSHTLTNINGALELQVGGIASDLGNGSSVDLSPLRTKFVDGIKGQQMMFTNVDGTTKLGTIDSAEGITLDDPEKILGEWVYKVSSYGNRIVNPQTGLQLEVSFDGNDLYELQVNQGKSWSEDRFRESQVDLQSDIDALSSKIKMGQDVGKDVSAEEKQLRGKERIMMEKERQRKLEG